MTSQVSSAPGLAGGSKLSSSDADRPPARLSAARGMTLWGLAASLSALAAPALAHPGHHETISLAEQARHLVTQPDHILALAGVVVLAVVGTWQWRRVRAKARK